MTFNLDGLGEIELAKLHREANRPLNKINEFNKRIKFCPCCSLPVEQKGYIERFNFCDNTDNFSGCGRGISLYYSYFRFSFIISTMAFILLGLPTFYISYLYSENIKDLCNKIYETKKQNINNTFPECINLIYTNENEKYFIYDEDWMLKFSSANLKDYRFFHSKTLNSFDNIDKVIFNYSIIYFICLISLFIINILYIIFLNNLNKQYDLLVTSPSDFTVVVTNLQSAFHIFWIKINKIKHLINERINSRNEGSLKSTSTEKQNQENELKEELGLNNFPPNQEINVLQCFHQFIKNKICQNSKGYSFLINQINVCYKIGDYMKIEEKIQEKKKQIIKVTYDPKQQIKNEDLESHEKKYFYPPFTIYDINICFCDIFQKSILLSEVQDEKQKLEKKLEELIKETENLTEENFAGIIFITFETMNEQEKFLDLYPKSFIMNLLIKIKDLKYFLCKCLISQEKQKRFLLKRNLEVYVAPEPEDIIYENLQYSFLEKSLRIFFIYFLSLIIIIICLTLILGLNSLQKKYMVNSNFNKNIIKYGLSLLITGVISLINFLFQICLGYLTKIEKHSSMTEHYLSFSIKLTIFTFITSAIVPLISNYYINKERDYSLLLTNITTYFLTNSIITPLFWTFNIYFLFKKLRICFIERKKSHNYTQRELNSIYELPDMKIAYKYSYIVRTLLMSFFYMPIFPISSLFSSFGFLLGYFLEKYNFAHKYKRPEMLNSKICEFYSNYFIFNFFMLGIGDYFFNNDINKNNKWSIINIISFGLLAIIPYNQFFNFDFLGINESDLKQEKYEDIFLTFYNDYERSNPITKKEGMKRFINKLKEKKLINAQEYEKMNQNIESINLMEVYYDSKKLTTIHSIKRSYTRQKTIIRKKSNYIYNFNNFIKQNKDFVLNYFLSLVKNQSTEDNNKITQKIKEESDIEKSNKDNQFYSGNIIDEQNSNPNGEIFEELTNRNFYDKYKESEQKINSKIVDNISSMKLNIQRKNYENINDSSIKRINDFKYKDNYNYQFEENHPNKQKKIMLINDNKEDNKDSYNKNNNIRKYKESKFTKKNQNDIQIYNIYKKNKNYLNKKEFKFKKYSKNILLNNDINKKDIYYETLNKIDNKPNNLNIKNKDEPDLSLFNKEYYYELHQKFLNQYKNASISTLNLNRFNKFNCQINNVKFENFRNYQKRQNNNLDKNFDYYYKKNKNEIEIYNLNNI